MRLATTPPVQAIRLSVRRFVVWLSARDSASRSDPERQINMDVMPDANAPKKTDTSVTPHAGLGCPRNFTKLKTLVKSQEIMVQIG